MGSHIVSTYVLNVVQSQRVSTSWQTCFQTNKNVIH